MKKITNDMQEFPRQLVNPRIDGIFKTIFTQNTDESRLALTSFIEAMLGRKITKLKLTANGGILDYLKQRMVDYDIHVEFNDGEQAEIEMEAFRKKYDYQKRAEYLVSRLMNSTMKRGYDWKKVRKVYQISILDFNCDKTDHEAFSHYVLRKENGHTLSQMLNVYFLELRKLPQLSEEQISQLNTREKWGILFRDADNPQKLEIVKKVANTEDGIMAAFNILGGISLTQRFWLWQTKRIIMEADRITDENAGKESAMKKGFKRGRRQGRIEGRKEGRQEGRIEGRLEGHKEGLKVANLETAKRLLDSNKFTPEEVAEFTNLSLEQVKALAK